MLKSKYTIEDLKAKQKEIECLGARANAVLHKLKRPATEIDHLKYNYAAMEPQLLNGETDGIYVQQLFFDGVTQKLIVNFGKYAYSPAHKHPHYSITKVVLGSIYDSVNGKCYEEGEWYYTPKDFVHSAQSVTGSITEVYNTKSEHIAKEIFETRNYKKFDRLIVKEWQ